MAVLQILVLVGSFDLEATVVAKKLVARGNQYIVTVESNATQATVGTSTLEVYLGLVPVDVLLNLLFLEIDCKCTTVTLTLSAATHDGCSEELR